MFDDVRKSNPEAKKRPIFIYLLENMALNIYDYCLAYLNQILQAVEYQE